MFLRYSRRFLRTTTWHTVSTRQLNPLHAKSSGAMARRQHDSPTERNQEAHLSHQSSGSATQQASTFESKPPNRFSKRHRPHSWEVARTCLLTSAVILSTCTTTSRAGVSERDNNTYHLEERCTTTGMVRPSTVTAARRC